MNRGFIRGFQGAWHSGLATLLIEDYETQEILFVPCDNAPTARALEAAFGNVITPSHTVNPQGDHIGKEILWDYDDLGFTIAGFTPIEEA
jgi:hypothetical protein